MNKIEIGILNPEAIAASEKMMVCSARLTQHGHSIKNFDDFLTLYNKPYSENTVCSMTSLPHPTIQKFGIINVAIVGASRRFLAQITRHQNEVKFMSASLQYSDYSGNYDFVVPYEILKTGGNVAADYINKCRDSMKEYEHFIRLGANHDEAGYLAPQALRNILIISATPYQWKHMISQRVCYRNTTETRYIMLKIWEALYKENPILFAPTTTGPFCQQGACKEGKMSCKTPIAKAATPTDLLLQDFYILMKEDTNNET